jgi:hypothetical protein
MIDFLLEVWLTTSGASPLLARRMLMEKKRVSKGKKAFFAGAWRFFHWRNGPFSLWRTHLHSASSLWRCSRIAQGSAIKPALRHDFALQRARH